MPGDYSEELVELVARALAERLNDPCFAEQNTNTHWEGFRAIYRHDARSALDALSSCGRLVPDRPGETADCGCSVRYAVTRIVEETKECSTRKAAERLAAHIDEEYSDDC